MKLAVFYFLCSFLLILSCNQSKNDDQAPKDLKKTILLKTVHGNVYFSLKTIEAPNTSTRFSELVQSGFYDGQIFYHSIPGKLIETGDPTSTGKGGTGKSMPTENNRLTSTFGTIIMAANRTNPNQTDSRFYIVLDSAPSQSASGTIFAQIEKGTDTLRKIQRGDKILSLSIE